MKIVISFVCLQICRFPLFVWGLSIPVVYHDEGSLFYAHEPEDSRLAVPLNVADCSPTSGVRHLNLPVTLAPYSPIARWTGVHYPPLSLSWFIRNRTSYAIMGDAESSAIGKFHVVICEGAFEQQNPEAVLDQYQENPPQYPFELIAVKQSEVNTIYSEGLVKRAAVQPLFTDPQGIATSVPPFLQKQEQRSGAEEKSVVEGWKNPSEIQTFWSLLTPFGIVARLPIPSLKSKDLWWPCKIPESIQWREIRYDWQDDNIDTGSFRLLSSENFPWDGFSPIGGVLLVGHKVKTDKTDVYWPKDADWLIWEKNTNGVVRLCQMKAGRWTPVREVPRAPQTIVIDNDTEMVHLLYDFAIDRADIDGSLRRLASLLKPEQSAP